MKQIHIQIMDDIGIEPPRKIQRLHNLRDIQRMEREPEIRRVAAQIIISGKAWFNWEYVPIVERSAIMEVENMLAPIWNSGIDVIKDTMHQQFYGGDPSVDPMEVVVAIEQAYNAYGYPWLLSPGAPEPLE
jgi:hypothetical protein